MAKPTLTILRGIPGSGKSTFVDEVVAEEPDTVVVSRDRIRVDLYGRERDLDEDLISVVEKAAIRGALEAGHNVISDNTNIQHKYVKAIANIAYELDVPVDVVEFEISVEEAKKRNLLRGAAGGRRVPDFVIENMFNRYKPIKLEKPPVFEIYEPNKNLDQCVLFDVDGTLAEMNGKRGPFDWDKVDLDDVVDSIADLTTAFHGRVKIIIFSGRDSAAREGTIRWLGMHGIQWDKLFMRDLNDMRPDTIVKMEMFDKHIRNEYHCLGVFDDRPSVVRQWQKHGVPVFHVKPYAKDF